MVWTNTDWTDILLVGEYYNDTYSFDDADPITVTSGITVTGIDFLLEPGVWLTGTVTVPSGYSAEGIDVDVWVSDGPWYNTGRQTDASGNYVVPVAPIYDSRWGLSPRPRGTDLGFQWAHQFYLEDGTNWDFDLGPGATITGHIDIESPRGGNIWANADSNWMGEGADVDENGYYQITNLPPGEYKVSVDSQGSHKRTFYGGPDWEFATPVHLGEGEVVTGINFDAPLLGQIEGHVYESDGTTPIEGLKVTAMNADGFWMAWTQWDGSFNMDLPAGDHKVLFEMEDSWEFVPEYYPGVSKWSDGVTVTVPALMTDTLVLTATIERAATLSGQVTDAGSSEPLGGILVSVLNVDPTVDREVAWWNCTDENGDYTIEGIWPGDIEVTALGTCGNYDYETITDTLVAVAGGSHNLDLSMNAGVTPDWPFTVRTNESFGYTPLNSGGGVGVQDSDQIIPALFAPLVQLDDQGEWFSELLVQVPTLDNDGAAIIDNRLVVTYTLQAGLSWSDGYPLDSGDIRFAWEMRTRPQPHQDSYFAQVDPAWKIESVETPDAWTAVLTYKPGEFPPSYLGAIPYPLPEHVLAGEHPIDMQYLSSYAHNPVGNGPYMVADWVAGSHLDLVANPNYHKRGSGFPVIEEVRFLFTDHPFWSLVSGAAEVSLNVDFDAWPSNFEDYDLVDYPSASWGYDSIMPNNELPFFQDAQVRQALYHALDKDLIDSSFVNLYKADNWVPPDHPVYTDAITIYDYNLTTAASLLTAAGWVDSNANGIRDKDGIEFEFDLAYPEGNTMRQTISAIWQNDLASIGVDANLIPMPFWDMYQQGRRGRLDTYHHGWGFDNRYDPMGYYILHSDSIPTAFNSYQTTSLGGRWRNATNDALLEAARTELDPATFKDLYAQQQISYTEQLPTWPIYYYGRVDVATPILLNFKPGQAMPVTWNMEQWELPSNPYDLSVRKALSLDSPAPQPGEIITYELSVNNVGYFTMSNVILADILPGNVSYVGASPAPTSIAGKTLSWDLGDLPGRAPYSPVLVSVQVSPTVSHGETITNEAQVSADEVDGRPGNNGYIHVIEVNLDVDLAVTKYGVGQPAVGEHYDYYINYANWGGAPATGVVITDTLPPEVSLLNADPAPDGMSGGVLTWTLPALAGNQWGGQIELTADIIGSGLVTNTAEVGSGEVDVDYGNNRDTHVENVDDILAPVIYRPTQGTTDGTPTISGVAPSNSIVDIYDRTAMLSALRGRRTVMLLDTWLISTTASITGTFSIHMNLPVSGTYVLQAKATKAGLTSDFSNAATIDVDHTLPLDPDYVTISADGVDISAGSVRAELYTLARRKLDVEAVVSCPVPPSANLKVTENGVLNYDIPAQSITYQGSNNWLVEVPMWLGEPHSTYDIWLEWDCDGTPFSELLIYILIDPDGFVYDQSLVDGGSTITDSIILNSVITAYVKVDEDWQIWPASLYGQTNPQSSDGTTEDGVLTPGYYSFLTPPGRFRIEAYAPGYQPYQSPILTVITTPVRLDIGLTPVTGGSGFTLSPADLGGSVKWVDKLEAWVGDELTYHINLLNNGDEPSGGLSLTDLIPANTEYISDSLTWDDGNAWYDGTEDAIKWDGVVPGDGKVVINYSVEVVNSLGVPYYVVNNAVMDGPTANILTLGDLMANTRILNEAGVDMQASAAQSGLPGQTLVYNHILENTGNLTDTYDFDASSSEGWMVNVPTPVDLGSGMTTTVQVQVTIAEGAISGTLDTTIFTTTSQTATSVYASRTVSTTVNRVAGVSISTAVAQDGLPGSVVTYTHQLLNTGNGTDTFSLEAVSDQGWLVTVSPDPTLGPGASTTIEVVITIPSDAATSTVDTITLTATSDADGTVSHFVTDVTTVLEEPIKDIYLPLVHK